jgi:DNA-directed RNA polymerase subunit F
MALNIFNNSTQNKHWLFQSPRALEDARSVAFLAAKDQLQEFIHKLESSSAIPARLIVRILNIRSSFS